MLKKLAITLMLLSAGAFAQLQRFDSTATAVTGQPGSIQLQAVLPGSTIYVCTGTATGATTCGTPGTAALFSDIAGTVPLPQPLVADANGNFGFFAASAPIYYTWIPPSGSIGTVTTKNVTLGTANALTFSVPTPAPYAPGSVSVVPVGTTGGTIYYYWVVSNFTIGNSAPSLSAIIKNAAGTLSSINYDKVTWTAATGANTYDLLRTTTATAPSGACACAVATAVNALTANDQSNSLSAYTVSTYAGNTTFNITNVAVGPTESALTFAADNGTKLSIDNKTGVTVVGGAVNPETLQSIGFANEYTGATVPLQLNACIAALSTSNGVCVAPTGMASGAPSSAAANVATWDFRGTQSLIGNASAYTPIFLSDAYGEAGTTNRVFGSAFQVHAQAGGTLNTPVGAETVGLFAGAERTGGDRAVWAYNSVTQYADHNNYALGAELDLNNNGTDATDSQTNQENGLMIESGGSARPLFGLRVDGTAAGNTWQEAAGLFHFHTFGLHIAGGDSGSLAEYIVPPDNTSALEIDGRNAANSADAWSITNSGNVSASLFNCTGCDYQVNGTTVINAGGEGLFNSLSINGGTAITGQTGTGGTAVMSASPTFTGTVTVPVLANGCSGTTAAMTAGTIAVTNACITGARPISLVAATKGGTQGFLSYTQSAGSLVITSSSSTDTSTVSWVQN